MNGDLDQLIIELAEDIENVIFFIGAGISAPSGAPTGFDIINESAIILTTRISESGLKKKVCDLLRNRARPETLFNYFEVFSNKGNADTKRTSNTESLFKKVLIGLKPSFIHNAIASFLDEGKINTILSLNYDTLIEDAVKSITELDIIHTTQDFATLIEGLTQYRSNIHGRPRIVKFHGHLQKGQKGSKSSDSGSLQYALLHLVPINPDKAKCLKWFIENCTLVFLGCSGNDDFDIAPILMGGKAKRFVWINHKPWSTMILPNADPETYLTNSFKIIKRQNELGPRQHIYLTIDTGQFMDMLLNKSGLSITRAPTKESIKGRDLWKDEFETWLQDQPELLHYLVMARLIRDFGNPILALDLLKSAKEHCNDPNLLCESEIMKIELLHLTEHYKESRDIAKGMLSCIDTNFGINNPTPLEDKKAILYQCQAHKRLAFMIRDEAQNTKDTNKRQTLREEANCEFQQWEKKLQKYQNLFEPAEFRSLSYQLNRDWAWLDRDAGRLTAALDRIERTKPEDPYNLAKSRLDGGWFAFDETKRRFLKDMENKDFYEKKAIELFTEAIDVCNEQGFVDIQANALRSRAHVYIYQAIFREYSSKEGNKNNRFEELKENANNDLQEALRLFISLGQDVERGITLYDLALFHHAYRDTQKARDYVNQASVYLEAGARSDALDKINRLKRDLHENVPYERHFIENLSHIISE